MLGKANLDQVMSERGRLVNGSDFGMVGTGVWILIWMWWVGGDGGWYLGYLGEEEPWRG